MTIQDLKDLSKIIYNDISHEDFINAAMLHNYTSAYTDEIWGRWCKNPFVFITSHTMGTTIFEMIQTKIETQKILKKSNKKTN